MKTLLAATALALTLAACSQEPTNTPSDVESSAPVAADAPPTAPVASATAAPGANDRVLTLEGLGALRVGQAVPADSGWAERGAQASDGCRTITSPEFPGVYGLVEGDMVRRITVGPRSTVKLIEGIGVGSSEAEVNAAFGGFGSEPHKYVEAPAKYLTAPNAASGDPALRFEIGKDGTVSAMHIGVEPQLRYVEGCS